MTGGKEAILLSLTPHRVSVVHAFTGSRPIEKIEPAVQVVSSIEEGHESTGHSMRNGVLM